MIHCKKHIIAAGLFLIFPLAAWSEVPVVDDSDNFAIEEQQTHGASARYKYDDMPDDAYASEDGPALAKEDQTTSGNGADNATLIGKIQSLQKEVQELRGQLEVQAHDLKLLQQQQIAFYKDLDSRLGGNVPPSASSMAVNKPAPELSKEPVQTSVEPTNAASRINPADEQISYLAAYELVKNKRYDDAINSMNTFVQKYPRGGYTANAEYWLGELYLVKRDYEQAVAHFNVVLKQFPVSSKAAASMLKMGYAYAAMGNKPEAQRYLQQVVRAYPNTPTAQLASSKLSTI